MIGVDIAEAMLSLARSRHPELDFRRGSAEELPFPEETFDAVVANFVLLHLGRPEQAAAEFVRVLAPGGRLALSVWDVPERARFIGVLLDAVTAAGARPPEDVPVGPPIFRFSDEEEFAALLRANGLDDVAVTTVAFSYSAASPDELWDGLLRGTVRTAALVLGQTEAMQQRIRAEFNRVVAEYRVEDGLELPVSVRLASGRKPT